ncbi:hypothetical protein [Tichowtungia aerotolerans]|uniref:Uncharacterized protein n=1 Tax=Tichowtungia aerotolerans TaxID=2697043 RepID=A0A6P1MCJ2_9BACT|nr:hypothetical protein [Tichowtungia aerotolerans]QHI68805.1 hypothetical protein GT409_04860 [Tichowtungia aerotolerans]
MPSTDIYNVKDSPWANAQQDKPSPRKRRRRRTESFDEVMNKDVSKTHRRRRSNRGFRRFLHLMKKPEFSKKFWTITLSTFGAIMLILLIWDWFFRYPAPEAEYSGDAIEMDLD